HNQYADNGQKDYKIICKALKAELALLTQKLEDEGTTTVKGFMATSEDEVVVGKTYARSSQWVEITMKKVHRLFTMNDGDERKHVLDYTKVDCHCVEDQRKILLNKLPRLNLDNESLKDEIFDLKKVIEKWNSSIVTLDKLLIEQVPVNIVCALGNLTSVVPRFGSNALACKVIVTLDKHKSWMLTYFAVLDYFLNLASPSDILAQALRFKSSFSSRDRTSLACGIFLQIFSNQFPCFVKFINHHFELSFSLKSGYLGIPCSVMIHLPLSSLLIDEIDRNSSGCSDNSSSGILFTSSGSNVLLLISLTMPKSSPKSVHPSEPSFGWVDSKAMIKFAEDVRGKPCTKAQDEVTFTSGKMTEIIRDVAHQSGLGAAYLELDMPQSAAQVFAMAKDIMDTALGPHHVDSIEACKLCIKVSSASKVATISEELCIGCGIYVKFELDVPMIQPQPVESTQGTHRTPGAPRSPNPKKTGESSVMKIPIRLNLKKKKQLDPKVLVLTAAQIKAQELVEAVVLKVDIMVDEDETESYDDDATLAEDLQYRLYLTLKNDAQARTASFAVWIALQCKYEKSYDPTPILIDTCRTDTLRKRNHDNQLLSLISQA
ncbi:hypothetical protein Tco_1483808, partial [Tanacetum coccineum]